MSLIITSCRQDSILKTAAREAINVQRVAPNQMVARNGLWTIISTPSFLVKPYFVVQMRDWLSKMIARVFLISFAAALLFHLWIIGLKALIINRDYSNLTYVPQDLDASVTTLSLEHNIITLIDGSSLWWYHDLTELFLSFNPLQEIKPDTFDNNLKLEVFKCYGCELYRFPKDFGPASISLKTIWFHWAIRNITAFNQMRLDRFTSLSQLTIRGLRGIDFDELTFPTSLTHLGLSHMRLSTFPNLSLGRFPKLRSINVARNTFQEASNFLGVTRKITWISIYSSNLHSADGLELLQNLNYLQIIDNKLETIPDLLKLPKLRRMLINGNSRMNCDKRMCWRRLWDRVRQPFYKSDDVKCVQPPLLAGHEMLSVNPKFMQCDNGKRFHGTPFRGLEYGPLARYTKLWVAHVPVMPAMFSPPPTSKENLS